MKQHEIGHITDLLTLSDDEFARMLPDLCVWWRVAKSLQGIEGATNTGFVWIDDGKTGVDHCAFTDPATGARTIVDLKATP